MNFSTILGYLIACATIYFTVIADSPNPAMLLEPKAFILVAGGSIAAALVIFPISAILDLGRVILFGVVLKRSANRQNLVRDIVSASVLDTDHHHLLPMCPAKHPFLAEGFKLIAENKLNESDLRDVLAKRSAYFKQAYMNDAKMLAVIAKFPSSFGMLGSTVGLIDMMNELGEKGAQGVGPAMAMAMVATFWGLVFTYMIFMPLSDYMVRMASEDVLIRNLMVEGLMMIKRGENHVVVLEKLNGFLALHDRMVVKQKDRVSEFLEGVDQKVDPDEQDEPRRNRR